MRIDKIITTNIAKLDTLKVGVTNGHVIQATTNKHQQTWKRHTAWGVEGILNVGHLVYKGADDAQ